MKFWIILIFTTKPNNKYPSPHTTLVFKGCNNDVYVTCQSLSMYNMQGEGAIPHDPYNTTWMYKRICKDVFGLQDKHSMGWYSST